MVNNYGQTPSKLGINLVEKKVTSVHISLNLSLAAIVAVRKGACQVTGTYCRWA
jgi:hypothetical protein